MLSDQWFKQTSGEHFFRFLLESKSSWTLACIIETVWLDCWADHILQPEKPAQAVQEAGHITLPFQTEMCIVVSHVSRPFGPPLPDPSTGDSPALTAAPLTPSPPLHATSLQALPFLDACHCRRLRGHEVLGS